jgi:biotin synthase
MNVESYPISTHAQPVSVQTVLRTIATARIVLPKSIIRLAAGRHTFTETEQAMVSNQYLMTHPTKLIK